LAGNRPFAAFWVAQAISLIGDRLNTIALSVLVFGQTGSALLTGIVLTASLAPDLVIAPFAGVLADRYDRRRLMVGADLARAGLVATLPFVVAVNPLLSLPITFAVGSLGLLFRPAKVAVIPRLVPPAQIEAATGAVWGADTVADFAGYPISAIVVGVLGLALLPIAFFLDAASYLVSAALLIRLPVGGKPPAPIDGPSLRREFLAGWRYLRGFPALFENAILSAAVQATIGAYLALFVVYAAQLLSGPLPYPANYPLLQLGFPVGNIIGVSLVVSLAPRLARGRLIIGGFAAMSVLFAGFALVTDSAVAFGLIVAIGIANMIWLIPASALIPEQTPSELIGRVSSLRSTIVHVGIIAGMIVASLMAVFMPVATVFGLFGLFALVATALGATRAAIRQPPVVEPAAAESAGA
jgi:MFS family permease